MPKTDAKILPLRPHFKVFPQYKADPSRVIPGVKVHVKRSLRDRWLTWPWKPWRSTELVQTFTPDPIIHRVGLNMFEAHPATLARHIADGLVIHQGDFL